MRRQLTLLPVAVALMLLLSMQTAEAVRRFAFVLVESPTYHLAVRIMRDHPIELVPVAADESGLRIDALEAAIADLRRAWHGDRACSAWCQHFHNPTGVSLGLERRAALVELAAAEELLIVEDDVYRELAYDGPAPPSLWSMAPPGVVAGWVRSLSRSRRSCG